MTVTISAKGRDFIVVGTDSRVTFKKTDETVSSDKVKKINQITKHCVLLMAGQGFIANKMIEDFIGDFIKYKDKNKIDMKELVNEFETRCKKKWNNHYSDVNERPYITITMAGLMENDGGKFITPKIYTFESDDTFMAGEPSIPYFVGGCKKIPNYIFDKKYDPNMNHDELISLVAYAISESIEKEEYVGGEINISLIREDGITEISKSNIETKIKKYQEIEKKTHELFKKDLKDTY